MVIGIDARFALHNRRGIGNYSLNFIQNLARISEDNDYILYTDKNDIEGVLPKQPNFITKKLLPSNYLIWEQILLPLQAKIDSVDLLHCTGNTAPLFLNRHIKLISSIHDVMYLKDYSEVPRAASLYQRMGRFYRRTVVPRIAKNVSMVLTTSEFSKKDIMKHIPALGSEKIKVIYSAGNEGFRRLNDACRLQDLLERFGVNSGYILTLGAADPRKNTELVIRKFLELKSEADIEEKLLIVGVPDWWHTKLYEIARASEFGEDVIFSDFVSEEDLAILYSGAAVFLYPSLYEGFGIPLLEAMACGAPIITSNTTSIPEVVGDAALMVDPANGGRLKASLLTLLKDKGLKNDLVYKGFDRVKKFSWEQIAKETLGVYTTVYGEPR